MLWALYVAAALTASEDTAPLAAATMSWLAAPMWLIAAVARTIEPPFVVIAGTLACSIRLTPLLDYNAQDMAWHMMA